MKAFLGMLSGLALAGILTAEPTAAQPKPAVPQAEQGEGVSLTVYNQNFVVVKERRLMDLRRGRSTVRFRDVAATAVPETVQFAPLRRPDAARVVEQNYEFDLVGADKLLQKYVDHDIALVTHDGDETQKGSDMNHRARHLERDHENDGARERAVAQSQTGKFIEPTSEVFAHNILNQR